MTKTAHTIYGAIEAQPGSTVRMIADSIGMSYAAVYNALTALEQQPDTLVSEDEYGRLYPFREKEMT